MQFDFCRFELFAKLVYFAIVKVLLTKKIFCQVFNTLIRGSLFSISAICGLVKNAREGVFVQFTRN